VSGFDLTYPCPLSSAPVRSLRIVAALILGLALVVTDARPALADELQSMVNGARSTPLPILADANSVARRSAAAQSAAGAIGHTDLGVLQNVCSAAGEIVGSGPDVRSIFVGFRHSPLHWNIITDRKWTSMGTGISVAGDGTVYVSAVFCQGTTTSPKPTATQPITLPALHRTHAAAPHVSNLTPCSTQEVRDHMLHEPPWVTGPCPGLV
jgi:hypothetical protein